jgi:hypothetical protein
LSSLETFLKPSPDGSGNGITTAHKHELNRTLYRAVSFSGLGGSRKGFALNSSRLMNK